MCESPQPVRLPPARPEPITHLGKPRRLQPVRSVPGQRVLPMGNGGTSGSSRHRRLPAVSPCSTLDAGGDPCASTFAVGTRISSSLWRHWRGEDPLGSESPGEWARAPASPPVGSPRLMCPAGTRPAKAVSLLARRALQAERGPDPDVRE